MKQHILINAFSFGFRNVDLVWPQFRMCNLCLPWYAFVYRIDSENLKKERWTHCFVGFFNYYFKILDWQSWFCLCINGMQKEDVSQDLPCLLMSYYSGGSGIPDYSICSFQNFASELQHPVLNRIWKCSC